MKWRLSTLLASWTTLISIIIMLWVLTSWGEIVLSHNIGQVAKPVSSCNLLKIMAEAKL